MIESDLMSPEQYSRWAATVVGNCLKPVVFVVNQNALIQEIEHYAYIRWLKTGRSSEENWLVAEKQVDFALKEANGRNISSSSTA